jgi:hypothetical protein
MILLTILFFVIILFLMYYGFCLLGDIDPFWYVPPSTAESVGTKSSASPDVLNIPSPDAKAPGYCVFSDEDLQDKNVFDAKGKQMSIGMSKVKCSDCNQYVYSYDGSRCTSYEYNTFQNNDVNKKYAACQNKNKSKEDEAMCEAMTGVCTVGLSSGKKCPF